jgi:hypothetical protein
LKRHGVPPAPVRKTTTTWKEFIRIHMAVLGATDFFTSEGWRRCVLVISSLCCFLYGGFHHVRAGGMTLHHHVRGMLVNLAQSRAMQMSLEGWIGLISKGALSPLVRCGKGVRQSPLSAFTIDDYRASLPHDMGKVTRMPPVHACQVRYGPLRRQYPCSEWRKNTPEKAT